MCSPVYSKKPLTCIASGLSKTILSINEINLAVVLEGQYWQLRLIGSLMTMKVVFKGQYRQKRLIENVLILAAEPK